MKRFVIRNKTLCFALLLAVLGAAALGAAFACSAEQRTNTTSAVEREGTAPLAAGSAATPTPAVGTAADAVKLTTGEVRDAADAYARVRELGQIIGMPELSSEYEAEYRQVNIALPDKPEQILNLWELVRGIMAPVDGVEGETWEIREYSATVDAETGRVLGIHYNMEELAPPAVLAACEAVDGEALLTAQEPYLNRARELTQALAPDETIVWTKLSSVRRSSGVVKLTVYTYTEQDNSRRFEFVPDADMTVAAYECHVGETTVTDTPRYYDDDSQNWIFEYENYDSLELVKPRRFQKGEPGPGQIDAVEARNRYGRFYEALTGKALTSDSPIAATYYRDESGEREDYWALTGAPGRERLDIAISADTGDLLHFGGELDVAPLLADPSKSVEDWGFGEGPDFDHAYAWLRKAMAGLVGEAAIKEVSVNAVYDGYFLTLDVELTNGRWYEFHFEIRDGKALLDECTVFYDFMAFWIGLPVPWRADVRYVDTNTGEIHEGWIGPDKLTPLLG